jgi:L-lactate utilization protein LutC
MEPNTEFAYLATTNQVNKTMPALEAQGMRVVLVKSGDEAKEVVLKLIPEGAEVFTMTSRTLESIGVLPILDESGKYESVRKKLKSEDAKITAREKRQLGAAPDWAIGSVHAITQDGQVMIASNTGSQLAAYVYGAEHVVWVVGTQKLVKNTAEGMRRIQEYSFPLEDERSREVYGSPSGISKVLQINQEVKPDRITVILVEEKLGF